MPARMQSPATLRLAVLPRAGLLTDAMLVAGGAGLIAASAQVSFKLPFTPVPITGQTFSVLLVGAALGTARGGASALLYVLAGLVFPVYAGHGEGWDVITSASGGYLVSYPFVAALTGWLAERNWDRKFSSAVGAMLTGNVVIYLVRPALARGRAAHEPREDARARALPVRPRRHVQALPRRARASGGVAASSAVAAPRTGR